MKILHLIFTKIYMKIIMKISMMINSSKASNHAAYRDNLHEFSS